MKPTLILRADAPREEWERVRGMGIGGSDCGSVLGLNPYKSAYTLAAEKIGMIPPADLSGNAKVWFGTQLEPVVATRFEVVTGKKVHKRDFNPRSPHGERLKRLCPVKHILRISIHAPRMGSDSTVKAYSNDRIKRSTLREPHFSILRMRVFRPLSPCVLLLRAQKIRESEFHSDHIPAWHLRVSP